MNENWLEMTPGAIGILKYYMEEIRKSSKEDEEFFVNNYVNAKMQKLITDSTLGNWALKNEGLQDPISLYGKSRAEAKVEYENSLKYTAIHREQVQVGNKEC